MTADGKRFLREVDRRIAKIRELADSLVERIVGDGVNLGNEDTRRHISENLDKAELGLDDYTGH